jgi:hypothetical protein
MRIFYRSKTAEPVRHSYGKHGARLVEESSWAALAALTAILSFDRFVGTPKK